VLSVGNVIIRLETGDGMEIDRHTSTPLGFPVVPRSNVRRKVHQVSKHLDGRAYLSYNKGKRSRMRPYHRTVPPFGVCPFQASPPIQEGRWPRSAVERQVPQPIVSFEGV